jgi:hypothetical protein
MTDDALRSPGDRWEQLNRCPDCGADMQRQPPMGEHLGLYYRCGVHGRFRYSWDTDKLERIPDEDR